MSYQVRIAHKDKVYLTYFPTQFQAIEFVDLQESLGCKVSFREADTRVHKFKTQIGYAHIAYCGLSTKPDTKLLAHQWPTVTCPDCLEWRTTKGDRRTLRKIQFVHKFKSGRYKTDCGIHLAGGNLRVSTMDKDVTCKNCLRVQ